MTTLLAALLLAQAAPPLPPDEIFQRAQQTWQQRAIPAYESFRLACEKTELDRYCAPGEEVEFVVRMSDGRTIARGLNPGGGYAETLMRGGYITGPAGAPLGFYRKMPSPGATPLPDLAPDPIALPVIATIQATTRAYAISWDGMETIDGHVCHHLTLRPLRNPDEYPLRALWVDATTFEVIQLTYARPFEGMQALVNYRFASVGPNGIWTIVHIDATADSHAFLATSHQSISADLEDIAFPQQEPEDDFIPGP